MFASLLLITVAAGGCASNYYDSFEASHPRSWVDWPPPPGAGLHETLAGLYAPPQGRWQRSITKLDVIRLDESGPVKLTKEEIEVAIQNKAEGSYGVVAVQGCRSGEGLGTYIGQKIAWFVLPNGVLHAWDLYAFTDHCTVFNAFNPASGVHSGLEKQVIEWRDTHFPKSMAHVGELYSQGIAYAGKGRFADAKLKLAQGDATLDVGAHGRGGGRREFGQPQRAMDLSDVERPRGQLARAIGAAETREAERGE